MAKRFNVTGSCLPEYHYMVDISEKLKKIKMLVDSGEYFTINRARQYGKTTTLNALKQKLDQDYCVFLISFEGIEQEVFAAAEAFCIRFFGLLYDTLRFGETTGISEDIKKELQHLSCNTGQKMDFRLFTDLVIRMCKTAKRPVVLMIDEVDQASCEQAFTAFLGCLRDMYLKRPGRPTFQSVILAGVHDIKNMKQKFRSEASRTTNSPWNIAADFLVDMSLPFTGIQNMLEDYEKDYQTGMNCAEIASLLYDYTSGYPFLVSRICKLIDERISENGEFPDKNSTWTKEGFLAAVRILLTEENTLFESLDNKLIDYPDLKEMLKEILFRGKLVEYIPGNTGMRMSVMYGFAGLKNGVLYISNRIFEIRLYNGFLAEESHNSEIPQIASYEKNLFITNGKLDMDLVISKFVQHYTDLFREHNEKFLEDNGRSIFLLYIRPIINGTGNYYIEAQTRNNRRTDLIIDFAGQQFIVELKIYHGQEYHKRGEDQLIDYLETYHTKKGYLVSFNFNKKKEIGVKRLVFGDKVIIEAVV